MLTFDYYGNLTPAKPIVSDLNELEQRFVLDFDSEKRKELFENYKTYLQNLSDLLQADFYQWIDGSFVTKKEIPGDIDVVK